MKKITIIVPVFNNEQFLEYCLRSIVDQSYKNIEIIVINDGSTDSSYEIIQKFASTDKRIIALNQENKGVSTARNLGLEIATGDYIGFVDSDDYIEETMYEELINKAVETDADIVECGYNLVFENKDIDSYKLNNQQINSSYNCIKQYLLQKNTTHYNVNKIYEKNILKNIRYPQYKYSEDFYFNCLAFMNCNKKVTIDKPLYNYFQNPKSATKQSFNINKFDTIKSGESVYKIISKQYPDLTEYVVAYILGNIYSVYKEIYTLDNRLLGKKQRRKLLDTYQDYYRKYRKKMVFSEIPFKIKVLFLLFYYFPDRTITLKKQILTTLLLR